MGFDFPPVHKSGHTCFYIYIFHTSHNSHTLQLRLLMASCSVIIPFFLPLPEMTHQRFALERDIGTGGLLYCL
jgi:hypothetical protein